MKDSVHTQAPALITIQDSEMIIHARLQDLPTSLVCDVTGNERHVTLLDPAPLEGSRECGGHLPRFCDNEASACLSI
jgi:hypothetical protein